MRPWRVRLALRRARVQWALLSVVLLVATLVSTLLSTLYLLADATETFAARAALTEAPVQDTRVVNRIAPDGALTEVEDASGRAVAELFGDVPYSTAAHAQTDLLSLPQADDRVLTYVSAMDGADQHVRMVAGVLPTEAGQTAVPASLLDALDLGVGDTVEIASVFGVEDLAPMTVVGAFAVTAPGTDFWRFDRFLGAGHNPATALPFSGGGIVTDGYGPLLTAHAGIEDYPVGTLTLEYVPDFSAVSLAQAESLIERSTTTERATIREVGSAGRDVRVTSQLDVTLGGVVGSLAVTRSSVLVTGLLLLVLSVAALAQTARLMSERRHAEQALMIARGASGRQLLRLGLIEAVVVAGITVAAAPPLAALAYQALSSRDAMARAGMDQQPGMPAGAWVVAGIVGMLLVVIMVAPLLKRGASLIETEAAQARPKRAAAFQRGGVDVALLVLAALAYWQLRSYESPVIADGGVARLDPLLAAGPALALLAGALVAVRLIPVASKALEGLAARGRRAVMPLAAWEVGRRSSRAVSAILLLTLAVSIGTFAVAYLESWRHSQEDQAQYRHPADAVVTGVDAGAAVTGAALDAGVEATSAPTISREGTITTQTAPSVSDDSGQGREVALVASTPAGLSVYAEGRAGAEGAAAIPRALAPAEQQSRDVIALPEGADGLGMSVTASTSTTAVPDIVAQLRAIVVDGHGRLDTIDLGTVPADGEARDVEAGFAPVDDLSALARPYAIAGLQTVWATAAGDDVDSTAISGEGALTLRLSIDDISALAFERVVPVEGLDPVFSRTPVDVALDQPWFVEEGNVSVTSLQPEDEQLRVEMLTAPTALPFRPATLVMSAQPVLEEVPLVVTARLASSLSLTTDDEVRIGVDGASVLARVAAVVPLLPGESPRQEAMIADLDTLTLAIVQTAAAAPAADEWWIDVADDDLDRLQVALPDGATMTSRLGEATSLKEDPLRVATQAALWLVTAAAVVLAAVGFAVHAVVTVRARTVEFAQLRAVGLARSALTRVVAVESTLLTTLGLGFGLGLGVALASLVAPLVAVGADGRPPLPDVTVEVPWATVGLLAAEAIVVLVVAVVIVSMLLRRIRPAEILRTGD